MKNKFNGFSYIKINITQPLIFNFDIELKNLNMMCGTNGSGKSFLNKILWLSSYFHNMKLTALNNNIEISKEKTDIETIQFLLDNTFDEQNINGKIELYTKNSFGDIDSILKIELINGKMEKLELLFPEDCEESGTPIYLSKESRNFSMISRYLKIKQTLNIKNLESLDNIEKLSEFHKIYDILAFENLLIKLQNVNPVLEKLKKEDNELFKSIGIDRIEIKPDSFDFNYYDSNNNKKSLTTLGEGNQSILIMITAVSI